MLFENKAKLMCRDLVVLMAEDNEGHSRLIQRNLIKSGLKCDFRLFIDGQQVLDFLGDEDLLVAEQEHVDFVMLLDLRLPKVDGIQVLRYVRSHDSVAKIPVIVLSTSENPDDIELCNSLGCSAYFTKPINYESFVESVETIGRLILKTHISNCEG